MVCLVKVEVKPSFCPYRNGLTKERCRSLSYCQITSISCKQCVEMFVDANIK